MCGIGLAVGNQIINHFFVELRPLDISLLEGTVDLVLFTQSFDLGTAQLSKVLFRMR